MTIEDEKRFETDREMLRIAYQHYQHLENIRQRYLTWYYTVTLASVAYSGVLLRLPAPQQPVDLSYVFFILASGVSIFGILIFAQLISTQAAIAAYEAIIGDFWKRQYIGHSAARITSTFNVARDGYFKKSIILAWFNTKYDLSNGISKLFVAVPSFFAAGTCAFILQKDAELNAGNFPLKAYWWIAITLIVLSLSCILGAFFGARQTVASKRQS